MTIRHRSISWKQLLNQHKQEFFAWLDEKKERLLKFKKLADDLEHYIMMCLTKGPYDEGDLSTTFFCEQFANRIPDVFINCDNPQMYEQYMAALAYAHVHL